MRERDKKGYPQFVGRILEWQYSGWYKRKMQLVRVAVFDYDIGVTLVNVYDNDVNYTCYNGPMSPNRRSDRRRHSSIDKYDKAFAEMLKMIRTNSIIDIDKVQDASGENDGGDGILVCVFGQ